MLLILGSAASVRVALATCRCGSEIAAGRIDHSRWRLFCFCLSGERLSGPKKETLKYAEKSFDADLASAFIAQWRPFEDPRTKPDFDAVFDQSLNTGDICPIKAFYHNKIPPFFYTTRAEERKFRDALGKLLQFYGSLAICTKTKVYDLESACNFFAYRAKELVTRHRVEFDRYELQFGYSPAADIAEFLASCRAVPAFENKFQILSYCEEIRRESKKSLKELYANCPP